VPKVTATAPRREAIAHARGAGHINEALDPVDLLILILALVGAWFTASPALQSLAAQKASSPKRLATYGATLATAVCALAAARCAQPATSTAAAEHSPIDCRWKEREADSRSERGGKEVRAGSHDHSTISPRAPGPNQTKGRKPASAFVQVEVIYSTLDR
jgi:hypothetical protein